MHTSKKIAYLTIDDSPSLDFSMKVDYLLEKNIPAIFFCIGQLMEERPWPIIESIRKGFQVANHSFSHPHFSDITIEQCRFEIEETDKIIDNLYDWAGVKRTQKWFRFPYGDKGDKKNGQVFNTWKRGDLNRKNAIQKILSDLNYSQPTFEEVTYSYMRKTNLFEDIDWHWTFDIMEWATFEKKPTFGLKNVNDLFQRMAESKPKDCRGKIGHEERWLSSPSPEIILLHDHDQTTPIFTTIIDKLIELPLEFKHKES